MFLRAKQPLEQLKLAECIPYLFKTPSNLEKNEYVRRIQNNQAFNMNIKIHNEWHCAYFHRGKYLKNMALFDFQEVQLKNVIEFWFIILNISSL